MLMASAVIIAWMLGLIVFTAAIMRNTGDTGTKTDAIVALTGGNSRIDSAIGLLNAGLAEKLFISGVNPLTGNTTVQAINGQPASLFACCITLGYQAVNTLGNAAETAAWIHSKDYHSLRLVTADYHMPRALLDFHLAMPEITILPHPVHPQVGLGRHALLILEEYFKYLAMLPRYLVSMLLP